jgi:hypothetical protein
MFGIINNLFGKEASKCGANGDMVAALERALLEKSNGDIVDKAATLRNCLRRSNSELSREDKVRVISALNKAKVRALMDGTNESYSVFSSLNSICTDVVALL